MPETAHNLDLGPDADAAHRLALLRAAELTVSVSTAVSPDVPLFPGVFLSFDPESAITGEVTSVPGSLLHLDLRVERPGRWRGLHFSLGEVDLTGAMVIGFACRSAAPTSIAVRVALRSGLGSGFVDCFFRKTLVPHGAASVHLDALEIAGAPELPVGRTWRDLALFFPPETSRVDLQDLRLFIV